MLVIEKIGYGKYKNSLTPLSIFLCIKHYPKKKVFYKQTTPVKGRGGNSIGQKKMLTELQCTPQQNLGQPTVGL